MAVRTSTANWKGTLKGGGGTLKLASGLYEGPYTWASRFESEPLTNPEELVGAALASCYSMFLSALLTTAGKPPTLINTSAKVHLTDGPTISLIELTTEGDVPGLSAEEFEKLAAEAKQGCPVSKALAGPKITLTAKLIS